MQDEETTYYICTWIMFILYQFEYICATFKNTLQDIIHPKLFFKQFLTSLKVQRMFSNPTDLCLTCKGYRTIAGEVSVVCSVCTSPIDTWIRFAHVNLLIAALA